MDDQVTVNTLVKKIEADYGIRVRSAVHLHNEKYPPREDILVPWLKDKTLTLVHAPTGVGKSWFVWGLAVGVATGTEFASWKAKSPKKVLIIDGEMHPQDLQYRLKKLMDQSELSDGQKENLINNFFVYSRLDQDIDAGVEFTDLNDLDSQNELLSMIQDMNPELVILDNLSTLANLEDENSAHSYNNIFRFLTKIKQDRSAILVHHDRKNTDKYTLEGYRGSSKLAAIFEFILHLSLVEAQNKLDPRGADFYVEFKKNRYLNHSSFKRRQFSLLSEGGWEVSEDEEDILTQVSKAVKSGRYATQQELGEHFGHQKAWACKRIVQCVNEGLLEKWDWKNYRDVAIKRRENENLEDSEYEKIVNEMENGPNSK